MMPLAVRTTRWGLYRDSVSRLRYAPIRTVRWRLSLMRIHSSVIAGVLACWTGIIVSACGSDDKNSSGGAAGMSNPTNPIIFTDNTSGKACTANADCGNGECRKEFAGIQLLGQAAQVAPGGYCTFKCNLSADCGAGGVCVGTPESLCLASCTAASDCRDGYRCVDSDGQAISASGSSGTCRIAPETDSLTGKVVGNACTTNDNCGGGTCSASMLGQQYPEGYCTGRCLEDSECGQQALCVAGFPGAAGTCFRSCSTDSECGREGYRCRGDDSAKVCLPGAEPLPNGVVGNSCSADADCGGAAMSCATSITTLNGSLTLPGGYCSTGCVEDIDCGSGGSCVGLGAFTVGLSPGCYKVCSGATDCRTGYQCGTVGQAANAADQPTVCTPVLPSSDADAGAP